MCDEEEKDRKENRRNVIRRVLKWLEVSILVSVMLVLAGLFMIPTLVFALNSDDAEVRSVFIIVM